MEGVVARPACLRRKGAVDDGDDAVADRAGLGAVEVERDVALEERERVRDEAVLKSTESQFRRSASRYRRRRTWVVMTCWTARSHARH